MRSAVVVLAIAGALALQTTVGRFATAGVAAPDLVLVVVVYVALVWGPVPGLLAGALGGLAQDALSVTGVMSVSATGAITVTPGIIGVGGLSKTIVGFAAGTVASQVILTGLGPRMAAFLAATLVDGVVFFGVSAVLGARAVGPPYGTIVLLSGVHALIGGLAFVISGALPGAAEQWRERRRGIARRL